jgi:hypothetical protein
MSDAPPPTVAATAAVAAAPAVTPSAPAATLARALARLARAAWPALDPAARVEGAAAIDGFVAAPAPSTFLAAARRLVEVRRRRRATDLSAALAERVFARGAACLAAVPFVDEAVRATLLAQPHDGAAGRRLAALACLLEAHAELAARVRSADAGHIAIIVAERERRR